MRRFVLLLALAACQQEAKPPPTTGTGAPISDSGAVMPAAAVSDSGAVTSAVKPATTISEEIRTKICSAECGGEMSSIEVYRDASGTIKKLYRIYGRCSHNAGLYFEPDGTEAAVIPEKPVVPGSKEAKQFDAQHQAQVGGLTKTDSISCRKR